MANKWIVTFTVEYPNPDNIEAHIAAIAGMQNVTLANVSVVFDKKFVVP